MSYVGIPGWESFRVAFPPSLCHGSQGLLEVISILASHKGAWAGRILEEVLPFCFNFSSWQFLSMPEVEKLVEWMLLCICDLVSTVINILSFLPPSLFFPGVFIFYCCFLNKIVLSLWDIPDLDSEIPATLSLRAAANCGVCVCVYVYCL